MEVILNKDVEKVGKSGAVVRVKDGFARNFLFPQNLAVPLTEANLRKLELNKQKLDAQQEKLKKEALELQGRLAGLSLTIPALVHEEEQLYGSVTPHEISEALKEEGFDIEKEVIILDEPIKKIGIYEISVKLHPEITTKIKLWIVKK